MHTDIRAHNKISTFKGKCYTHGVLAGLTERLCKQDVLDILQY